MMDNFEAFFCKVIEAKTIAQRTSRSAKITLTRLSMFVVRSSICCYATEPLYC